MATFEEIGKYYAAEVREAIAKDQSRQMQYVRKAALNEQVEATSLRGTALIGTLKRIAQELETLWKINDKPLTEVQKGEIIRHAGIELGLPDPGNLRQLTEGASNDAYMQMVTYVSQLLTLQGKK